MYFEQTIRKELEMMYKQWSKKEGKNKKTETAAPSTGLDSNHY